MSDHPRIRGEHNQCTTPGPSGQGSSPHTRGARIGHTCATCDIRIIPAYAGSTGGVIWMHSSTEDHPRIRGEHYDRMHVLEIL